MIGKLLVLIGASSTMKVLGVYSKRARKVVGGRWSAVAKTTLFGRDMILWEMVASCPGIANAALKMSGYMGDSLPESCCFDDTSFVVSTIGDGICYGKTSVCNCEVWQ